VGERHAEERRAGDQAADEERRLGPDALTDATDDRREQQREQAARDQQQAGLGG
jgi:hypothetical protein